MFLCRQIIIMKNGSLFKSIFSGCKAIKLMQKKVTTLLHGSFAAGCYLVAVLSYKPRTFFFWVQGQSSNNACAAEACWVERQTVSDFY